MDAFGRMMVGRGGLACGELRQDAGNQQLIARVEVAQLGFRLWTLGFGNRPEPRAQSP